MTESIKERVMDGLKQFQRNTVQHIARQFYGADGAPLEGSSGRFLVADETGLGKSVVARGVIAHTLETMRARRPERPVNVVYVCSNLDLARQNLTRLNVGSDPSAEINTRLTMLATETKALQGARETTGGGLNLISFTPGTSFSEAGTRQGKAGERALLAILLDRRFQPSSENWERMLRLLRGGIGSVERFKNWYIDGLRSYLGTAGIDPVIERSFGQYAEENGILERFFALVEKVDLAEPEEVPPELWSQVQDGIADLRNALAKAGVESLQPDLVILDEFQRFRHLLDPHAESDAAELARELYSHGDTRVLLLSATPYKPFTRGGDTDGDHYEDFLAVVRFLCDSNESVEAGVRNALENYRGALTRDDNAAEAAQAVRNALLPLMTRAERPEVVSGKSQVQERPLPMRSPTADDLLGWVGLQKLADKVGSPVQLDRWKSVPYFANYMDGYKLGHDVTDRLATDPGSIGSVLSQTQALPNSVVEADAKIDPGNAKLRVFIEDTVEKGWWRAIWVPPSMPYLEPGRHFAALHEQSVTKQLIFSSWAAVPTAVASLVSREVMRHRTTGKAGQPPPDESTIHQLEYSMGPTGAPGSMSTLTLFWPHPTLAEIGDPVRRARQVNGRVEVDKWLRELRGGQPAETAREAWHAYFAWPGSVPEELLSRKRVWNVLGDHRPASGSALRQHLDSALDMAKGRTSPHESHRRLPALAAFAPGNTAYRALRSIAGPSVSAQELWAASFVLASGLRTLFNRGETITLLNTLDDEAGLSVRPYWQKVLAYCADGNLQAVLDEYLFQLRAERGGEDLDGVSLMVIAEHVVDVLSLHRVNYRARDVNIERAPIDIGARWALRYGDANVQASSESGERRQANVRGAFNSPFAPFVLTSTSAGQEGIDFHWWSHAVVHWNLPSNPVDFEQREGRVNRFGGHAIRKNVAEGHWADVLASDDRCVWRAAFDAASALSSGLGEFAPWWVYPGSSRIHRVLTNYPLSVDQTKYEQLKRDLVLYRLTLGQPRQEDMIALLAARGVDANEVPAIDLSAPQT